LGTEEQQKQAVTQDESNVDMTRFSKQKKRWDVAKVDQGLSYDGDDSLFVMYNENDANLDAEIFPKITTINAEDAV
jgi:hypothetical protein